MPGNSPTASRHAANAEFGTGDAVRDPRLAFRPPLGWDIALAISTNEPLHGAIRPPVEDGRGYHAWPADRIRARRVETPGSRGEPVFALILTEPG